MKYLIAIILILSAIGCETVRHPVKCRHDAVMSALVFEERGSDTRIVRGKTRAGEPHAQAQAMIDGKWQWLNTDGYDVSTGFQDGFNPQEGVSTGVYLMEFWPNVFRKTGLIESPMID